MHARRHVFLATLCLVALAACGSSDKTDTSAAGPTTTFGPVVGDAFSDPQGAYTLTIGGDWMPLQGSVAADVEVWAVSATEGDFAPNVNLLTQQAGDLDLEGYLDLSFENSGVLQDFKLVQRDIVRGRDGQELGLLSYTGAPGGKALAFLAYVAMGSHQAVVATLTTPPGSFDRLRPLVEPYLSTLRIA